MKIKAIQLLVIAIAAASLTACKKEAHYHGDGHDHSGESLNHYKGDGHNH